MKVALAELESASVAVTAWLPTMAEDETVKITPEEGIAPVEVEVVELTVVPSNFMVTAEVAAKPLPVTLTFMLVAPWLGLRLMAGVTVNEAVGELVLSVRVTV
jgi:hypothetical protein